jgi:hypothetical protein
MPALRTATLLAGALSASLLTAGAPPAAAARAAAPYDFNGDGRTDLAIGAPDENVGRIRSAGAVNVLYAGADGLRAAGDQYWTRGSSGVKGKVAPFAEFGDAHASGDFDRDGFADLAITAEDQVNVLYGSARGLRARGDQLVAESREAPRGQMSLATADLTGDGRAELVVGYRADRVKDRDAGRVVVVPGGRNGLRVDDAWRYTQATRGVPGRIEHGDLFGAALATGDLTGDGLADLAVGAPGETVDGRQADGAVWVLVSRRGGGLAGAQTWNQATPGVPSEPSDEGCFGHPEEFGAMLAIGDFAADGRADLAVGVPGEETATSPEGFCERGGLVHVLTGAEGGVTAEGTQTLDASMPLPPATSNQIEFGRTLAVGDFNGDRRADLAVGSGPGMTASAFYGSASGLATLGAQRITRTTPGISDGPADRFDEDETYALTAGHYTSGATDSLAIGSAYHLRIGTVTVVAGSPTGLDPSASRLWSQASPGVRGKAENCDFFGALDGVTRRPNLCVE